VAPADNQIVSQLAWSADAGALSFNGVRYLLIRPETLMQWQQGIEAELGARADDLAYAGGFMGGRLSGQRYKQAFGLNVREAVEFMCRMGGQIGWGRFEILRLDLQRPALEVLVHNSAFAQGYAGLRPEGERRPVCHLIRGVLGGLLSGLLEAPVRAQERECLAAGAAGCRFVMEAA
jgi:predicted hydrocarbon binding protein